MSKANNAILGFMVGGGLAFSGVVVALSGIGAEDVRQYLLFFFGLPVGLFGGAMGAVIGVWIGTGGRQGEDGIYRSPQHKLTCQKCGRQMSVSWRTCRHCGGNLKWAERRHGCNRSVR